MNKLLVLLLIFLLGCTVTEELYDIDLTIKPYPIIPNTDTDIGFKITKEGNPIPLEINHERIVHVLTVREDLEEFKHIHPENFGKAIEENIKNSEFGIKNTFTEAAKYLIVFEFQSEGKVLSKQVELDVGDKKKEFSVNRDLNMFKSFGEYGIEMIPLESVDDYLINGALVQKQSKIKSNERTGFVFRVVKDGNFVSDLEPYLGSKAHFSVWKEDLTNFMHLHAYESGHEDNMHGIEKFGPNLPAVINFPEAGYYKIFVETQHKGKTIVGDFMVEVN